MANAMMIFLMNYDSMKNFGTSFRGQETATQQTIQKLTKVIEQLRGGDWIGEGATAFYSEMDNEVIPAMKKLQNAMSEGDRVSKEIERLQHETESSITALFADILSKFAAS
ncbi:MAG TPA: WXG100 family type VII secretion target [Anaerolineales bacterium]|nr:WXG100 family type VII secretion target [Anaerolineales bacterium]